MLCLVSSTFLTEQDGDLRGKLHLKTKKRFYSPKMTLLKYLNLIFL